MADYILHNRHWFRGKHVMELGSGVGLTSIAAAMHAQRVVCTDINLGGILELIARNIRRNEHGGALLPGGVLDVMELDFKQSASWSAALWAEIRRTDVFLAADVIYDNDLTDALVETIDKLLSQQPTPADDGGGKTIYIALEKRYVFTMADLESLAPCYEYFLTLIERLRRSKNWRFESIPIDFPQYFEYERVKHLVLLRLSAS